MAEVLFHICLLGLNGWVCKVREHYCGYVKLPANHPWTKFNNDHEIPADVHGGITFLKDGIIGFDTAHYCGWNGSDISSEETQLELIKLMLQVQSATEIEA